MSYASRSQMYIFADNILLLIYESQLLSDYLLLMFFSMMLLFRLEKRDIY